MEFVSIVGTQLLAVLNPLLSLKQAKAEIQKVHLLSTVKTHSKAEAIRNYLSKEGLFSAEQIEIKNIAFGLEEASGLSPAHAIVEGIHKESPVAFNVAGGLNFQIAACINTLDEDSLLLYPEARCVYRYQLGKDTLQVESLDLPRWNVDVLTLQEVPWDESPQPSSDLFEQVREAADLQLPANVKRNVRIGNVIFDTVWNCGNTLRFLTTIPKSLGIAKQRTDKCREIMELVEDRLNFGELYSREICILTDDSNHASKRLQGEGRGKVQVFYLGNKPEVCYGRLRGFFEPWRQRTPTLCGKQKQLKPENDAATNSVTLATSLGRDIVPTLIAVWSRKPSHLVLTYTPESPEIEKHVETLRKKKDLLPVKQITLVPVSLSAHEILDLNNLDSKMPIEVNITPGLKSQAAMLTYWARRHGAPVFSIETMSQKILPVSGTGDPMPLVAPSPAMILRLSGYDIYEDVTMRLNNSGCRARCADILDFLHILAKQNVDMSGLLDKGEGAPVGVDVAEVNSQRAVFTYRKYSKDNKVQNNTVTISKSDGYWFEDVVGMAFGRLANDCQVSVATKWDPQKQRRLDFEHEKAVAECPNRQHVRPFMTETDVIARFGSQYYTVSCKAKKDSQIEKTAKEIKSVATLFGRFTIPLVADFRYSGDPYPSKCNGVYVFGYKTLANSEDLQKLLSEARQTRTSQDKG